MLLHLAKQRATRRGQPFSLTVDDVKAVWPADGMCPVLGIELRKAGVRSTDQSPTLDRLNNAWGYEPGNVAVVSMRANRIKGNASASELERVAGWMKSRGLS